jgi:hypothetical protein
MKVDEDLKEKWEHMLSKKARVIVWYEKPVVSCTNSTNDGIERRTSSHCDSVMGMWMNVKLVRAHDERDRNRVNAATGKSCGQSPESNEPSSIVNVVNEGSVSIFTNIATSSENSARGFDTNVKE